MTTPTETPTASAQITREVTAWPGIEAGYGRRGEWAFTLGRREIGHLHGDHAAHFFFPKDLWHELQDRKSTRLNSSHLRRSRMPSSA